MELQYHTETIGPSWEPERKLLDAGYVHIDLPFERKERLEIPIKKTYTFKNFLGYINTQSALKTLREKNPDAPDPVHQLAEEYVTIYNLFLISWQDDLTQPFRIWIAVCMGR